MNKLYTAMTGAAAIMGAGFGKYTLPGFRRRKPAAKIGKPIRACPGGRHAWFESDCGPVRKPAVIANE